MKNRTGKTFLNLMVSYLLILLFTVSAGFFTYMEALKVVEKDAAQSNLMLLRQSSEVIDARLKEVENIVSQVSFHPKVSSILNVSDYDIKTEYYKAIDTWNYIQSYNLTSGFIYNFYLYFRNGNVIMSPRDFSLKLPLYYERLIHYSDMDYDDWYTEFIEKYHHEEFLPAKEIVIGGKSNTYITYLQSIPLGFNNYKGVVIVLIEESQIHELLYRLDLSQEGWLVISDANGRMITSIMNGNKDTDISGIELIGEQGYNQQKINGQDMIVSFYTSPKNGWRYISAIPTRVVMEKADNIKRLNTIIVIGCLLTGIFIALFFAYRNTRPIRAIINKLSGILPVTYENTKNEYYYLDKSISSLIDNNEALQLEIEKQIPLLRSAFFNQLFGGEFSSNSEVEATIPDMGIKLNGKWFLVAVLRIEWLSRPVEAAEKRETINMKRVILKDLIQTQLGDHGFIHDLQHERMAVLMKFSYDDKKRCMDSTKEMLDQIMIKLNNHSDMQVSFGVGSLYSNLPDVYRSLKEALQALESGHSGESIMWYSDMAENDNGYYYPIEIEQRMMILIKAGNDEGVGDLLRNLWEENFSVRRISSDAAKLLMFDISATVYKLMNESFQMANKDGETGYGSFLEHVSSFNTIKGLYDYISEVAADLCRYAISLKKSHNTELRDSIIHYLDTHFHDGELSLAKVADFFGINETYLSQFFKEQTGENFSNYLEKTRMENACRLLENTSMPVNDIAREVGYINTNTFYKAFKRLKGISPGNYRTRETP